MLFVVALGGNALSQRGQPLESSLLKKNIQVAAKVIGNFAAAHQVVVVHGNGPQVGLLALQSEAYKAVRPYPLDILDAESQGMIGYLLQQGINYYSHHACITILTQVIVHQDDPAFMNPTKPIGPVYTEAEVAVIKKEHHCWIFKKDNDYLRRVVPSPKPIQIQERDAIQFLLEKNMIVIAAGGGGIPCVRKSKGLVGVEAVVDKDLTAALLAQQLNADHLVILTDVDCVYRNWGSASPAPIKQISTDQILKMSFAPGSMQPKVKAAVQFTRCCQRSSYIGQLDQLEAIISGTSGTEVIN